MGSVGGKRLPVGKRGGFDDGLVDLIPDVPIITLVGEGCRQERLDTVEVEV
jgi:hypothetical protein